MIGYGPFNQEFDDDFWSIFVSKTSDILLVTMVNLRQSTIHLTSPEFYLWLVSGWFGL